jgi:hypothetical protein
MGISRIELSHTKVLVAKGGQQHYDLWNFPQE